MPKVAPAPNRPEEALADARWAAVAARDKGARGSFYYGVKTTEVYCHPGCPSRLPRRDNVLFFATTGDAERAGFRACQRCKPKQAGARAERAQLIRRLCQFISESDTPPTLSELAELSELSPTYLQKIFKAELGVTPKAYAAQLRASKAQAHLQNAPSVTEAIYAAGYSSSGRFYAGSKETLGMTPREYRAGGAGLEIRFATGECSLGTVLVAATDTGICAVHLGEDPKAVCSELSSRFPRATLRTAGTSFEHTITEVIRGIEHPRGFRELPLDIQGTAFQRRVWEALRQIPAGETRTYSELAQGLSAPKAVRAVGSACGANPIAVLVPCHRAVGKDGQLSGYRWGIERKRELLKREKDSDE